MSFSGKQRQKHLENWSKIDFVSFLHGLWITPPLERGPRLRGDDRENQIKKRCGLRPRKRSPHGPLCPPRGGATMFCFVWLASLCAQWGDFLKGIFSLNFIQVFVNYCTLISIFNLYCNRRHERIWWGAASVIIFEKISLGLLKIEKVTLEGRIAYFAIIALCCLTFILFR